MADYRCFLCSRPIGRYECGYIPVFNTDYPDVFVEQAPRRRFMARVCMNCCFEYGMGQVEEAVAGKLGWVQELEYVP